MFIHQLLLSPPNNNNRLPKNKDVISIICAKTIINV